MLPGIKNLYIAGAGGFGREVVGLAQAIKSLTNAQWEIRGFLDDTDCPLKDKACDYTVTGTIKDYSPAPGDAVAVAIGDPHARADVVNLLQGRRAVFAALVHPWAGLGQHCSIGEGSIIQGGFAMTANVSLGAFSVMLACLVGHDVTIGDFTTVSSHCNISGKVEVGRRVFMGGNVAVAPGLSIGDDAYLCMGSIILKNVPSGARMLGNPAREIGSASAVI